MNGRDLLHVTTRFSLYQFVFENSTDMAITFSLCIYIMVSVLQQILRFTGVNEEHAQTLNSTEIVQTI